MQTVIDDEAAVFTLLNTVTALPERQGAVLESLRVFTERFARFQSGFIGASVHASLDGHHVVNYVQWRREADMTAWWEAYFLSASHEPIGANLKLRFRAPAA